MSTLPPNQSGDQVSRPLSETRSEDSEEMKLQRLSEAMRALSIERGMSPEEYDKRRQQLSDRRDRSEFMLQFGSFPNGRRDSATS